MPGLMALPDRRLNVTARARGKLRNPAGTFRLAKPLSRRAADQILRGLSPVIFRPSRLRVLAALPLGDALVSAGDMASAASELRAALLRVDRERGAITDEMRLIKEQLGPVGMDAPLVDGAWSETVRRGPRALDFAELAPAARARLSPSAGLRAQERTCFNE